MLTVGLSALFAIIVLALVFFVDLVVMLVPPESEARLFANWTPEDLVTDAIEDERVRSGEVLLKRLAAHWPDAPYEFRLAVSDQADPNAFALPGGLIVLTTGLLDGMRSENELAFVLGHELGHYKHRDHIEGLGRAVALGLLFAALGIGDADGLGIRVADLTLRGFSRAQEREADRFGLELVYREYGHVADATGFFQRLLEDHKGDDGLAVYLSTHPGAESRIEALGLDALQHRWDTTGPTRPLPWRAAALEASAQ